MSSDFKHMTLLTLRHDPSKKILVDEEIAVRWPVDGVTTFGRVINLLDIPQNVDKNKIDPQLIALRSLTSGLVSWGKYNKQRIFYIC